MPKKKPDSVNRVGRPVTLTEDMSTIRVRASQRVMLNAMKKSPGDAHHKILSRVMKYYFKKHPKAKERIRKALEDQ